MIPEGWSVQKFGDVTRIAEGQVDPRVEPFRTMRHIGPENVARDTGQLSDCLTCEEIDLISGKYAFDEKAIVYSKIRPNLNKVCFPRWAGVCSADMYPIWPVEEDLIAEFLYHTMLGPIFVKRAVACSMRTGMPKINRADLTSLPIELPPLHEQRRIAEILSTWDRAIETVEALIANARTQKQALMQSLLTGKKRLPGFAGEWHWVTFSDVFERVREKNEIGNTNVLTISAQHGLISQVEYFNKSVASVDVRGYTLLRRGDFAYNKSYSDGYPMGAFKPLERYDSGIVSSLYICFRLASSDHDHDFFRHYFEAGLFNQEVAAIAQEGARNHGLLNVSVVDFFDTSLHAPSREEQAAIAHVINEAESIERGLEEQLAALRQEKSALMQQLLTGKRRVKLPEREVA